MKNIRIEGFYQHGENRDTFTGELVKYDDGRVVGSMVDHEAPERSKLVLGLLDDSSFRFWKLQPLDSMMSPIVYNMESRGNNQYEGKWIPFNNLDNYIYLVGQCAPEIIEAHSLEKRKANQLMATIPLGTVEFFCDRELMAATLELGWNAELNLK